MATEKKINSRIQQKHDVAANWAKATNFIPKKGEIIIYDAEYNASGEETQPVRFKIGDGSKTVNNLPFAVIDRTVKLGGGSAPSGATTPSSETVVDKLYVNKFLNSKSFRAICEWLDSDQILVMITTEYSVIYLHHCVGMFKSEITTSSSDITPVDTSNLGTYHFIIATEVYNTGTEVTRKVLYSERSGDAHFSYRDPVTGSTVTWEDTVDAGWSGMVNENYEYDAGGDYRIIIQPVYYGFDQGKTPVGNYFFAGSPFTVEYASSILSSVVTESVLGGDKDTGYYCNKTWRTNRLSGWRCYQTGNLIGDFPFNTNLNTTACGTCFYNITGEASNSSEGSLQGTSLKRVVLQANGAIIIKIVPIVSNRADGNGDWTLCACSLYAGSTYANYGLWVIPNPLTIGDPLGDNSETVFWNNSWTFDTTKGFVPELNGPVDGKQVKYINFEALSLLNKYFIFTQQYETIRLSINEIADIQGKYALAMASSVGEISTSLINVEQSVSGKQDKITSTNKLSSDLVSGLGAAAAKAVDTAISANSTSTNLPTSKAVEDRINAHSGIDKVGTITGIKMNGASKGTSGVVDLGTVITAHQDISGKANLEGGNTFTGKQLFNNTVNGVTNQLALNETQWDIFTCRDLTTPTMKTAIGKGFVWCQDSDAIYSQFKATGIYYGNDNTKYDGTLKFPTDISGEKTIATTDQIPDVSGKANLSGGNTWDGGTQDFILPNGQYFFVSDEGDITLFDVHASGVDIDPEGLGTVPFTISGSDGASGQVLTSQGAGKTPIWKELVTLDTDQDITGHKTFTTLQSGGPKIGIYNGRLSVRSSSTSEGGIIWDTPNDNIAADFTVDGNGAHLGLGVDAAADIVLNGDSGTAGQVLTSQGANMTPQWKSMPTYSLSGTTLTITLP